MRSYTRYLMAGALTFLAGNAHAAQSDLKAIFGELAHIPTAEGRSVLDRMRACKITVDAEYSSLSTRWMDVMVRLPAQTGREGDQNDIVLRWTKNRGNWAPDSGWATRLMYSKGKLAWLVC